MEKFESDELSHFHSLSILTLLYEYDTWLDNIENIADMGCGYGLDSLWWATLKTRDDPPIPHNYNVYAIDKDISKIKAHALPKNLHVIQNDFSNLNINVKFDFIWAHDSFQYSTKPYETLCHWSGKLNENGWLALTVPQHTNILYNKFADSTYSNNYYHYTVTNLLYLLAVSGFDCKNIYVLKKLNNPWLQIIVQKSKVGILDLDNTSWYDLLDKDLLDNSASKCISDYGHLKADQLLLPWLDRNLYKIDYEPVAAESIVPKGPIFRFSETKSKLLKR